MKKVSLHIENYDGRRTVTLDDETSFGRTDAARITLGDSGLSRLNTSFFRDEDLVFVVDENSTNGTHLNGEKISAAPRQIFDGDRVKIGSETTIRVEIGEAVSVQQSAVGSQPPEIKTPSAEKTPPNPAKPKPPNQKTGASPLLIMISVGSTLLILFLGIAGFLIFGVMDNGTTGKKPNPKQKIIASAAIPIRVVDPLGGEDPDTLDDLLEAWEGKEAELDVKNLEAVTTSNPTSAAAPNGLKLDVTIDYIKQQIAKANEKRNAPTGLVSVNVPAELGGRGIGKQIEKIKEMGLNINNLPKDFGDLAKRRMQGDLIELPAAAQFYYLDVGGSADTSPFMQFDPNTRGKVPYAPGMDGYNNLATLAANFDGQKYDLNNPDNRRQMKIRLLRMFHPSALKILNELGGAYFQKFGRPLKVTSLTRSLEYQYELTKSNSNAFKGATPPHTTGYTFDIAYLQMTAEEQNFVMTKLAEFENRGSSDSLREVGSAPCIHTFVYFDGKPPKSAAANLTSPNYTFALADFLELNFNASQLFFPKN